MFTLPYDVKKDTRDIVLVVGAAVAVVAVIFGSVFVYSGLWPPFSVVESGSMQHGEDSSVGIIDTGDMVIVRDKDKVDIQSYVDGYHTGYSKFGEYGDVIIYERGGGQNPVIHRAILWLEWNGSTNSWDAPSLDGFPGWYTSEGKDDGNSDGTGLTGTLTLTGIGYGDKSVSLDLDKLPNKSGYATMGDNAVTNRAFDQGYLVGSLVSYDMILYVAGLEVPWIGCIKLYINDTNVGQIPSNSVPSMIFTGIAVVCVLIALFVVIDYISWYRNRNDDDAGDPPDDIAKTVGE